MAQPKRGATSLSGVLLVDKPAGLTSHDVVDWVRRLTGEGRVGHAGTLDPAATGLLLVCVGPATKLSEQLMGHDKEYLARIAFGTSTTTDDAEGEVLATGEVPPELADPAFAQGVLASFTGQLSQVPPQYSAIKQQGVPAYAKARKGQAVELAAREVTIYRLELLSSTLDSWDVAALVSKGTYMRALARDIGEQLGCPAHLAELRRMAIGPWRVSQAHTLDQLEDIAATSGIESALLNPQDLSIA